MTRSHLPYLAGGRRSCSSSRSKLASFSKRLLLDEEAG
jgi:hypothetical protein